MKKMNELGEIVVLLSSFKQDINPKMVKDSSHPLTETHDYWRVKTYEKRYELIHGKFRDFEEPYQVAQFYLGGTWNEYNAPFIIQVANCNLDCHFCFVPKEIRSNDESKGRYFTSKDVIDMFLESERKVLRVSGGEPFLFPEFLKDLGDKFKKYCRNKYLWIDTNLLGYKYIEVIRHLNMLAIPYGVCGCFKGFDEGDFKYNVGITNHTLSEQFQNAKIIVDNTMTSCMCEVFFYVPEITQPIILGLADTIVSNFIGMLKTYVHNKAPLRTTVLRIKSYESNMETFKRRRFESGKTKEFWLNTLEKIYKPEELWLPQYQIRMD